MEPKRDQKSMDNPCTIWCKKYKKTPVFIDNGKSYLVGDVKKIKKLGWKPKKNIFQILNEYLTVE